MSAKEGYCRNPLIGIQAEERGEIEAGQTLAERAALLDPQPAGLLLCKLNGEIISRLTDTQRAAGLEGEAFTEVAKRADNWHLIRVRDGDILDWHDEPANRDQTRLALQAVVFAVVTYVTEDPGTGLQAAALVGTVFNLIIPARQPKSPDGAEGVFSAALSGNVARLDSPIWKLCGRIKVTPPFAHQPYGRFEPSDPLLPDHNRDQYAYVLLALGLGNHNIEKALIGKTSLLHFQDITRNAYLAPGVQPTLVKANTVTAEEVSGQELISSQTDDAFMVFSARYVGGFTTCKPGDKIVRLSIDVIAPQGLGKIDDSGKSGTRTCEWQVEQRPDDDYGRPISDWIVTANEARTDDTNTEQRWTSDYELDPSIRAEVRLVRTDVKGTKANVRDGIEWAGMRGELERQAPLNAQAAHYEIVMRGSDQLSAQTGKDFSIIARALCRTWDPDAGWLPEDETRNPAWWALDLLREAQVGELSPRWGLNLPDERIDLLSFYDWAQTCDQRQDRFDYAFTETMDGWDALQLICRAGRARAFRRNGVISVARDDWHGLDPVAAFSPRNTVDDSLTLTVSLPGREQADGVLAQYLSNVTWDTVTVECPAPGYRPSGEWGTVEPHMVYDPALPVMSNPVARFYQGITGSYHAEREGLFDAAADAIRRTQGAAKVEMEGAVLAYLDTCWLMPEFPGYGQSGDVAFWDGGILTATLTEPPRWDDGPQYLTLRRDDGTLTDPVEVSAGAGPNDVILPALPDFDLIVDAGDRERPKYLIGVIDTSHEVAKLIARTDGGKSDDGAQLYDLAFLIDDERVHTRDNPLLPGPGDLQDPIDSGTDYPDDDTGGGYATVVRLRTHLLSAGNPGLPDYSHQGGKIEFSMHADGSCTWKAWDDSQLNPAITRSGSFLGEWLNTSPVDPSAAALYEVYAEDLGGGLANYVSLGATLTGDFNAWLNLGTTRTWTFFGGQDLSTNTFGPDSLTGVLRLRVKRVANATILVMPNIFLTLTFTEGLAGGGADGDGG